MQLIFLGTASCYPTPNRGVSCTALRLENGDVWIFDCGEGSQIQLQKSTVRPGRITKVFITHLHGDHLFGLPGLMCTLGNQVNERPDFTLEIYGPQGIRRYVRESLSLSRSQLPYYYIVHELIPDAEQFPDDWSSWSVDHVATELYHPQERRGKAIVAGDGRKWELCTDNGFTICAGYVVHRVPTFGFVVCEPNLPGRLDTERLKALGVPPGPLYNQIKQGTVKVVTLTTGKTIDVSDVVGPSKIGRKLTILGDTSDARAMAELAVYSDVVIHEATLEDSMIEKAVENGHSTPSVAAEFARQINARKLVLYHYSQRYKPEPSEDGPSVDVLLKEAEKALDGSACQVVAAGDLMELNIARGPVPVEPQTK